MARKLHAILQNVTSATHEGARGYSYKTSHPLTHLTFTFGSALFTNGYYEDQSQQVYRLADALLAAHEVEPRFAWQYGAWMRDPKHGKGNRIQGSLVPAILDAFTPDSPWAEEYVTKCLSHRPDDLLGFVQHFETLKLGKMSGAARRGVARALTCFDEYQLMKYGAQKQDTRLCDVIFMVRRELEEIGDSARLAIAVGEYLHASSRDREAHAQMLPLTRTRRELFRQPKAYLKDPNFSEHVREARVTWEQVMGHFGTRDEDAQAIWRPLLETRGLVGDTAFLRNINSLHRAGFSTKEVANFAKGRAFEDVWPHQVMAAFKAVDPRYRSVVDGIFERMVTKLPSGRHLGIADASGSMSVRVGGAMGSITARDVAYCFTALMSETSGIGASFADDSMIHYSKNSYLSVAERRPKETALEFTARPELSRGWGGTQVFGAVMELIVWLKNNPRIKPPECLWFFSDMQFHPATGKVPKDLQALARQHGIYSDVAPLELALKLYRKALGADVDVVLWNLAAYSPVPVAAGMKGVLLVSGFDAHTFKTVERWRKTGRVGAEVAENQAHVLNEIRKM